MNDPWSTCCPKCAAQISANAPACWMCGHSFQPPSGTANPASSHRGAPSAPVYAASTESSDAAQALWILGSLGVCILVPGIVLGLAAFSPGLAIIFALIAIPILVALYRLLRQSANTKREVSPQALSGSPAAGDFSQADVGATSGPSPAHKAALVVGIIGIALLGAALLFVAGVVVFFLICAMTVKIH